MAPLRFIKKFKMKHEKHLLTAIKAAIEAGDEILDVYGTEFRVDYKSDDSPLTEADRRAHNVIMEYLASFGIPVLSEEGRDIPYAERSQWQQLWIVDPLDGTKEFVKRNGEFTVNIALVENGRPIMGVVYVPVTGVLYFADREIGCFRAEKPSAADLMTVETTISISEKLPLADSVALRPPPPALGSSQSAVSQAKPLTIVGSRSHSTPELEAFVEEKKQQYGEVEFISAGSSLKICLVAEGRADIYPRLGPTMEWDTAAGQAVAEGAGALLLRHDNEKPLTYNKQNLLNPWFIVSRN